MALFSKLFSKFRGGSISSADWVEIERALIESDLGASAAAEIIAAAKKMKAEEVEQSVLAVLKSWLSEKPRTLTTHPGTLTTILVVGVNGTGKTTSVAKLANFLQSRGDDVIVAAADTFRAAATEQLQTWGQRLGIPVVAGKSESDPAAVAFEAVTTALSQSRDYLIVDTAGRLHTKSGLMDELSKVRRVLEKKSSVDEVLLVIDGTTGQNGIAQAWLFTESVAVTGLIVTKLDGSARGGIALAIERETGLPIKFIGTGESVSDLQPFDGDNYLLSLISE